MEHIYQEIATPLRLVKYWHGRHRPCAWCAKAGGYSSEVLPGFDLHPPRQVLNVSPACGAQVLVEGPARRTPGMLTGRTCHNKRVVFPADDPVPVSLAAAAAAASPSDLGAGLGFRAGPGLEGAPGCAGAPLKAGDYVAVEVRRAGVQSLGVQPISRTTAAEFVARFGSTLPGGAVGNDLRAMQRELPA